MQRIYGFVQEEDGVVSRLLTEISAYFEYLAHQHGESPPLQGRPVRRQDVDAGAKLAPQRKSEDLYYRSVFAVSVCAAASDFPVAPGRGVASVGALCR